MRDNFADNFARGTPGVGQSALGAPEVSLCRVVGDAHAFPVYALFYVFTLIASGHRFERPMGL